jgi:hypothetical protein
MAEPAGPLPSALTDTWVKPDTAATVTASVTRKKFFMGITYWFFLFSVEETRIPHGAGRSLFIIMIPATVNQ